MLIFFQSCQKETFRFLENAENFYFSQFKVYAFFLSSKINRSVMRLNPTKLTYQNSIEVIISWVGENFYLFLVK